MAAAPTVRMVAAMAMTTSPVHRPRHSRGRGGRDSADGQVLGALLVLGGVGWFVQQIGLVHLSVVTMLSCLLIALGVGLVLTARRAGGVGLFIVGMWLTLVLASTTAVDASVLRRGAGERRFVPTTADELSDRYQLGVGSITLDLGRLSQEELAGTSIDVQLGVGELIVLLPPRSVVPVDVRAEARAGEVVLLDRGAEQGGTNLAETFRDRDVAPGAEVLDLDLGVGLGTVQVVRPDR